MLLMLQAFTAVAKLDGMMKMWFSFIGMGLMIVSALLIFFARSKTKGWIRVVLTIVSVIILIYGCGFELVALF
ncbi:DUF2768 family protein [Cohnella suwonensis]|uniref:DUF2768 family protein n=1 Tax=Cohnella suwonensis TaxID=696072 RepID=A0ABW0LS34_9BACL